MSVLLNESSEPITSRDQLVTYFARGAKPKERWLIGVEHEKFPYRLANLAWPSYEEPKGLRELMQGMQAYGWQPIMEGENVIGLTKKVGARGFDAAISFEPGGQIELAGAPWPTLHEANAEFHQHLQEVCAVGEKLGIGFLGIGFHPMIKREDVPWVPKRRYQIMRAYMPKVGKLGLDMMLRTCTVQVNLDYADEADMIRKYRLSLAVQPIATALFASSPFTEGKANGFNSYRMQMWQDTDNERSGAPEFVYENGFGFERYTDYALDVPMYFVYRGGKYIDCAGQSFREFMEGRLPMLPGEKPTLTDWGNHLTTLFPDVRLKKILEMRGADAGDAGMMQALPAFWVGLLYDSGALDAAWDIAKQWSAEDRKQLRADVLRQGLRAKVRGRSVAEIAKHLLDICQHGLHRRARLLDGGADESRYLEPLFDIADAGQNRADELLKQFGSGAFDAAGVFKACRLLPP
jgi:glutamate--cysteine ligase